MKQAIFLLVLCLGIVLTNYAQTGATKNADSVLDGQIMSCRQEERWTEYADLLELKMRKHQPASNGKEFGGAFGDAWMLNSRAWDIFLNCDDMLVLKRALNWSDLSIKLETNPDLLVQFYDTKGNLLNKLGRAKEAIGWEEKALSLDGENAKRKGKAKGTFEDIFKETIRTMRNGKPPLDTSAFKGWPKLNDYSIVISNDGNYAGYSIGHSEMKIPSTYTLVLKSTFGSWHMTVPKASSYKPEFTADSRFAIFMRPDDTLEIVALGNQTVKYITNVGSFKLIKGKGGDCLAYQLKDSSDDLVLSNMETDNKTVYQNVRNWQFSNTGSSLLLQSDDMVGGVSERVCRLINLEHNKETIIWRGSPIENAIFDEKGTRLVFAADQESSAGNSGKKKRKSIWCYKAGEAAPVRLAGDLDLASLRSFSEDGDRVFVLLSDSTARKTGKAAVGVDVWSYTDVRLQSGQFKQAASPSYLYAITIQDHRMIRLQQEDDRICGEDSEFLLVAHVKGDNDERNWNIGAQAAVYLVSVKDGSRRRVDDGRNGTSEYTYQLSPGGKFVVWYNNRQKSYFSYEVITGVTRNITKGIPTVFVGDDSRPALSARRPPVIDAWMKNDGALFLRDRNDIWQVDPIGIKHAIDFTNGYGKKHNMVFCLGMKDYAAESIGEKETVILSAFDNSTKDNGFFSKIVGGMGDPEPLTMGPYFYYSPVKQLLSAGFSPIKARDANVYVVQRESAARSRNYFSTKDFKSFYRLSDLRPEEKYNWLTTELVSWKTFDGRPAQGILYKPENFDPSRKYPVIFHYYETKSELLNMYDVPAPEAGQLEIPWFVSNGYLVFTPDIHYTIGEPGESAYNSVVSAAKYLSGKSYVDAKRMAIEGHSWGGYETYYLVTHTNIFAAALAGSGPSDLISGYGSIAPGWKMSLQFYFENEQLRMGATLWDRPDLYIKNSPVFHVPAVSTPFLMLHNRADGAFPDAQAIEMFTGLRRLGKRAWFLQYDGQDHSLIGEAAYDYTIRMTQFFNHYLKDSACPRWMLYGIPASDKGLDDGLQLVYEKDPKTGKWLTPKEGGLLTNDEKARVQGLQHRKPTTVTIVEGSSLLSGTAEK